MNATSRTTSLNLLATLAGSMMLVGTAVASEGSSGRPSAGSAGDTSMHQAQYGASSTRSSKHQVAVADRNNTDLMSHRRAAGPRSSERDRNNTSLPNAQSGPSHGNPGGFGTAVADRDNAGIPTYGRAAGPRAWSAGRDNTGLPQATTHDPAELCGPCIGDVSDRDNTALPEAEILEAMLRAFADPFGFGTDEADHPEADEKPEDDSSWPSCDPMDRDADGDVDFDDFKILAASFGTDEGDLDGDGIVTGADLGLMLVRISTATAND